MNKAQLIELIQNKLGADTTKKHAEEALAAVLESIKEGVQESGKVQIIGFGTFATKTREARTGRNPKTGKAIGMNDVRTNLFPFVDVTKIDDFYAKVGFKDFKHNVTGAALTKMQHPDVETYWNSTHDKAGVGCADCHMPKMKDKNTGKV